MFFKFSCWNVSSEQQRVDGIVPYFLCERRFPVREREHGNLAWEPWCK